MMLKSIVVTLTLYFLAEATRPAGKSISSSSSSSTTKVKYPSLSRDDHSHPNRSAIIYIWEFPFDSIKRKSSTSTDIKIIKVGITGQDINAIPTNTKARIDMMIQNFKDRQSVYKTNLFVDIGLPSTETKWKNYILKNDGKGALIALIYVKQFEDCKFVEDSEKFISSLLGTSFDSKIFYDFRNIFWNQPNKLKKMKPIVSKKNTNNTAISLKYRSISGATEFLISDEWRVNALRSKWKKQVKDNSSYPFLQVKDIAREMMKVSHNYQLIVEEPISLVINDTTIKESLTFSIPLITPAPTGKPSKKR